MKRRIALALVTILACGMVLTGCGNKEEESQTQAGESAKETETQAETDGNEEEAETPAENDADNAEGPVIGLSMHCSSSFFDGVISGVEKYVEENGGRIINVDGRSDANYQMGVIEDFIAQDVDAVIYCPVDAVAATPALKLLKNAGIPVINVDSAVEAYDMIDAFIATDNYEAGFISGEALVKNNPEGGKVAILDYPINDAAVQRATGFYDAIKDHGFEVVAQLEAGVTPDKGKSVAEDVMQAHPDLTAIFVICDDSAQGAYAAIKSSGLDVSLYSVNGGPESKAAFREDGVDGVWKCSPAQSPETIGYKGTEAAYKLINGEEIEKEIFIPSFAIDATNVEQYPGDWQ